MTIDEVARTIAKCYDYEHNMEYDTSFSDGQYKKTADNSLLMSYYKNFEFTDINDGISQTVQWFKRNINNKGIRL